MTDARLRTTAVALALAGAAISAYLTWIHYAEVEPLCTGISDCVRVQTSEYAKLAGIPVAVIGLVGYLAVFASLAARGANGRLLTAFLALVGAGFSVYLTYVELAVIHAVCQWCIASALVMILLAGVTVARLLRMPAPSMGADGFEPPTSRV
jgi:uncharacterized membrane protein